MSSKYGHYLFVLHLVRRRRESWLHIDVLTLDLIIAAKSLSPPPKFQPHQENHNPLIIILGISWAPYTP
jgi:hypothetical protein